MNHTYRLIWNKCSNAFVVVSELAKACGRGGASKQAATPAGVTVALAKTTSHLGAPRSLLLAILSCFQMQAALAHTDSLGWVITPDTNTPGTSDVTIFYGTWHNGNVGAEGSLNLTGPNGFAANSVFAVVPGYVNRTSGTLPPGLVLGTNYFFPNTATAAVDFTSVVSGRPIYGFQSATFMGLGSGLYHFGYAAGPLTVVWTPSDTAINAGNFTINGDGTISVVGAPTVTPVNTTIDLTHGNVSASVHDLASVPYTQTALTFDGGTLRYGADTVTTKAATLNAAGGAVDTNGHDVTLAGVVGGAGAFAKAGAGTLVLSGANTFTGGAAVNGGVLQVGADQNLGAAAGALSFNGGVLQTTASFDSTRNIVLAGSGGISTAAQTVLGLGGVISGSGALDKSGSGTLALSGANSFTGGVAISGGVLQVAADNNLGDAAGALAFTGGALHVTASFDTSRNVVLASSGRISTDDQTVLGLAGTVGGSGDLIKSGSGGLVATGMLAHGGAVVAEAGSLVLSGVNTYAGGTVINSGATVSVSANENLGATAGAIALQGGTLHVTGSFDTTRGIVLGAGSSLIHTDAGSRLASSGAVSGGGALVKGGDGTLVLNGVLAHGGGTTVNAGVLALGGANTYTGNTVVNGGVLQVGSNASLGDAANSITLNGGTLQATASFATDRAISIATNSQLVADAGTAITATGAITGSGRLFKAGAGTLVLNGDNIGWTGGTTIDGGLVRVDSPTGIGTGDVILNGGTINPTVTLTTGQSINVGANTGVNTNADTTTTLTGNMQSMAGADDGCFIKAGSGTLNMQGTAVLRNGTCVEEGMLRANGTLESTVRVDLPGTLRGSGLITGNTIVFGRLAPGNSPGTLTSQGSVTMMPGSTFQADINGTGTGSGPGNYSRLILTGATSQYSAGGATLVPNLTAITGADVYTPYVPKVGERFRIVSAEGGIVGRYAPLVQPDGLAAGTRMAVFYDAFGSNAIDLAILPASYAAATAAAPGASGNLNAQSAASALDRNLAADQAGAASTAQGKLAYLLSGLQASQVASTVAALSGEIHGALAAAAPLAGQSLEKTVTGQLGMNALYGSRDLAPQEALWADLVGARAHWRSDGTASGMQARELQLTIGADLLRGESSRIGLGLSHAETTVSTTGGSGSVDHNLLFAYGRTAAGPVVLDGLAGVGRSSWDSRRGDALGMTPNLKTAARGNDTLASIGVSAPWTIGTAVVAPFARVLWQKNRRAATDEGAESLAALTLDSYAATGTRVMAGLSGGSIIRDPLKAQVTYRFGAALGHDGGDAVRPGVDAALAGSALRIEAPQNGRSFLRLNANLTAMMGKSAYAWAGVDGEARSGRTEAGINVGARIAF